MIARHDTESTTIKRNINTQIEISHGIIFLATEGSILWQTLTLNKVALRDSTIFHWRFYNGNRVVFEVVENTDFAEMILFNALVYSFLEVCIESQHL